MRELHENPKKDDISRHIQISLAHQKAVDLAEPFHCGERSAVSTAAKLTDLTLFIQPNGKPPSDLDELHDKAGSLGNSARLQKGSEYETCSPKAD